MPDQILAGLGAQRQVDGADQYGFSRTGFTGQDIQSLAELHLRMIDQRQVLHLKMIEHENPFPQSCRPSSRDSLSSTS